MALVKYGGGIIQMSGSIAGNTHARNRFGNYVRARTKPVNPNSDLQAQVRASMTYLVERWSGTLTAVQRTAWNLYGSNINMLNKLGETIQLTGFNHYIRSNASLVRIGLAVIDDGPVVFELPAHDPAFAFTATEATQEIVYSYDDTMDWANEALARNWVFQGQPQNPQRNFFAGPWRLFDSVVGNPAPPPASPQTKPAVFAIAEGQHLWLYMRIMRADGRISTPFRADALVGA